VSFGSRSHEGGRKAGVTSADGFRDAPLAMSDPKKEGPTDPVLEALWSRALQAWDDDKVHRALLDHAGRAGALPEVAARYRALAGHPEMGPGARRGLDAVVATATAMLQSMKTPASPGVPLPITLSALGICAFLLLWLAWAVWGPR
jgi:hypothetical protein